MQKLSNKSKFSPGYPHAKSKKNPTKFTNSC